MTNAGSGHRPPHGREASAYGGAAHDLHRGRRRHRHAHGGPARRQRWYDLTVISDADTTFLRRFAGHVETGATGVSDPAIITA